ncbi:MULTISPECIES: MHYT domain-containing protein [unclassified Massilia]|uniref:MHYT domain-containing protein n=1 Tax=unclassified Massilia TaxID=2609279 RepID=UPI00177A9B92|nr:MULTISPECIES: MHYT domain-containing protein [unclassified Massilia]MBD8532870.1 PAS domain S-box protein [Massilia sp. CFBP 13647]MBD8676231.1 PAS domain S-box protein [Massilia sp. CFBP 13721]
MSLFMLPDDPSLLSYGIYDPKLVVLSLLVAIFASWMGLQIAGQARQQTRQRTLFLLTGSLALGAGVWAMHFIGMLAFNLCTQVDYDPMITILSNLPSIGASYVALTLIARERIGTGSLLVGGVLVGAGIGAMHYTGMAGMRMSLDLRYDPFTFGLSIVVAVVLATLALWVRFGLTRLRRMGEGQRLLVAAIVMGCAITGMHYTGMAAARFVGTVDPNATFITDTTFLALAISLITVLFTVVVLGANGLLRYRQLFLELSRSEAWMRALLTTTVDGVITIDRDGTIEEFNASAEKIFGWRRDEIIGKNIRLLMTDAERADTGGGLLGYLRDSGGGAAANNAEVETRRRDGSLVPLRVAVGHARLRERELFVCFVTDITERRQMETALRASEAQFRSLIGNIPGISYRSRIEGAHPIVFISDAVERVAGYPARDFIGDPPGAAARRNFGAMIHAADRARVSEAIQAALAQDRPYLVEYRLLHADGSTRWMWENGTGVRNEAGELAWLDGVILDISERRTMEDALREAKEAAEQAAAARASFVANMSHEIRTPMNSILGFTDVLLDGELAPDQRRHLDTVRSNGRSLLRLLNEILDTAKLEKGAVELEINDFNLLSLIDELSSTLAANARTKGLQVDLHYDPALPTNLRGDELRIRQVLTNLLDNAIKFTAAGSVVLRAGQQEGMLHVSVKDTGIGIAPERLQAIFDPFTQADASMTRRFGGTGLGTTISKQLVELMGGRIWAESVLGEGTTFHVMLPLVVARFAPQQARVRTAAALPPLRVLAADDVPQNLELLQLLLARRGHTLTAVADGGAVVEMAARQEFDLVLMDFQMPVLDGLDATRRIREQETQSGRPRVPVIAMTASVLPEHRRASAEVGMDGFATKPVDWVALSHEIARVLGLGAASAAGDAAPALERHVLNRHGGVHRWGGKEDAWREALEHFHSQHALLPQFLQGFLDGTDYPSLRMLAHKARGVAANIGLELLAEALAEVEQLAEGDKGQHLAGVALLPDALARAAAAHAAALLAIRAERPAAGRAPAAPPSAADLPRALRSGRLLGVALARGALDDAALAGLAAALSGHPAAAHVTQVQAALSDFDFDLAQQQLDAVLTAIISALGEHDDTTPQETM